MRLAMAVVGIAAWASFLLARRVVDRRRAVLVLLLLLIYPVFSFKGSRYGTDLPQVAMFVLVVLAFLIAFEARTIGWGIVLGLACAGAVLIKYWGLFVVGAVGLAAIAHPERARFFRSWTPYVAAIVFLPRWRRTWSGWCNRITRRSPTRRIISSREPTAPWCRPARRCGITLPCCCRLDLRLPGRSPARACGRRKIRRQSGWSALATSG